MADMKISDLPQIDGGELAGNDLFVVVDTSAGATKAIRKDEMPAGGASGRELLTANTSYYVRKDGNDSNDGLTNNAGGAFLTVQKAVDVVSALDTDIYQASIYVRAGTYSETVNMRKTVGQILPIIRGDETTPSNIVVNGFWARDGGEWKIRGFRVTNNNGIRSSDGGTLYARNMSSTATGTTFSINNSQMYISGTIDFDANCTAIALNTTGYFNSYGATMNLNGTHNWGAAGAYYATGAAFYWIASMTWGGSGAATATGRRYNLGLLSAMLVQGAGASYIPGGGATDILNSGSQYQ